MRDVSGGCGRGPTAEWRRALLIACADGVCGWAWAVVAMGILALISSGAIDGLGDRVGSALTSGPSASGQQRVTSADVSGRAHVLDGDTIEVGGVRVRLEGLHCPEGVNRAAAPRPAPCAA
jgi:hypothetical protein